MTYRLLFAITLGICSWTSATAHAADSNEAEQPVSEAGTPDNEATIQASPELTTNVHLNATGLLLFGVTPAFELGGEHWSGLLRARFLSTGLLAHSLIPVDRDDELKFSWGAGAGLRYYSAAQGPMTGFHLGLVMEYLAIRVENTRLQAALPTGALVPQLEGGYRWRFDRFLVGVGAGVGYAFIVSRGVEDLSNGQSPYEVENVAENKIYGTGAVEIGYFF